MRRSPYCARSCSVPFWPGLRCSRTRGVEDPGERWGRVAWVEGPAGAMEEARSGGRAGLGSWTADVDPHRRPSVSAAYETGSSLRTMVMRRFALYQPTGQTNEPRPRNVRTPIRWAGRRGPCLWNSPTGACCDRGLAKRMRRRCISRQLAYIAIACQSRRLRFLSVGQTGDMCRRQAPGRWCWYYRQRGAGCR
jgi:hypothetical protein